MTVGQIFEVSESWENYESCIKMSDSQLRGHSITDGEFLKALEVRNKGTCLRQLPIYPLSSATHHVRPRQVYDGRSSSRVMRFDIAR